MSILKFILQIAIVLIYLFTGVGLKLQDIYNQNNYLENFQIISTLNDIPPSLC